MPGVVLLVEDDDDLREQLAFLLEDQGYAVHTAAHGAQALERLGELATPCCIIILDLMMPIMDGWQFRAELLKQDAFAEVPVVVLSGTADVHRQAQSLQAVDYLDKPVNLTKLYRLLDQHC